MSQMDPRDEFGRSILRNYFGIEGTYRCQTYTQFKPNGVEVTIFYRMSKHGVKRRVDAFMEVTQVGNFTWSDSGPLARV